MKKFVSVHIGTLPNKNVNMALRIVGLFVAPKKLAIASFLIVIFDYLLLIIFVLSHTVYNSFA